MKAKMVSLSKKFNESISTRFAIECLFAFDTKDADQVILNFSGIRLISSSAAHQFNMEVRQLEKKRIIVKYCNVNDNIQKMLELSSKDRKNLFTIQNVKHQKVNSSEELDKFLLDN